MLFSLEIAVHNMKRKIIHWGIPVLLTLLFIAGRITAYGPMIDSVAAHDTESYFAAAAADFPSIAFFEQMRSATLPLLIKILNPSMEHTILILSEPFFGTEPKLAVQPGTESIILFQTVFSIMAWIFFILILCSRLNHAISKALLAGILYFFAFVPQIADWDAILLSESLSFSLFLFMMGILVILQPKIIRKSSFHAADLLPVLLFLLVSALWLFTRDTNAYFIAFLAIIFLLTAFILWIRNKSLPIIAILLTILLSGIFVFQQHTFKKSERWLLPFLNNMSANVFPYPGRTAFFEKRGMPVSEEILSQSGSAEYNQLYDQTDFIKWAKEDGLAAYTAFLIDMPLWSVLQVYSNLDLFFEENLQPFFFGDASEKPHWADSVGNLLHPLSAATILIDLLLLLILIRIALVKKDALTWNWAGFCLLLFAGGILLMSLSFLGEVRSIWRHVLCGVFPLRLVLWILGVVIFDQVPAMKFMANSAQQFKQ